RPSLTFPPASTGCRPTGPDDKRLLQKLFRSLLHFLAGFHCFIERDAEVKCLVVGPVALAKIRFGRVNVIKPRGKFFIGGPDMKTVAVVARILDVIAIGELDPFFFVARTALAQKRGQQNQRDENSGDHLRYTSTRRSLFANNRATTATRIARSIAMC